MAEQWTSSNDFEVWLHEHPGIIEGAKQGFLEIREGKVHNAADLSRINQLEADLRAANEKAALAERAYSYIKACSRGQEVPSAQIACALWVQDYDVIDAAHHQRGGGGQ